MNQLSSFIARARTWYAGLPAQRRTSLLVGATLSFALTAVLWGYAAYDPMVLLFDRPMDPRSTSEIMDKLDAQGVEYHFEPGSQRIKVPKSLQGQLKVDFQSEMMGAAGGMDLLDNAPIGTTQFMERRRWAMALQREIESQINGFDQVLASKVLLSIPEESLFAEDKVDPSASVYVELKTGAVLSADEGARVAAMVAAAVPRLAPDRVEILDSELRVLHAMKEGDAAFGMSAEMAELQRQYDAYFTGKIERLLERVVGPGKVAAEVHVELDHTERTVQQRELDGENAVVIAQRSREATSTGDGRERRNSGVRIGAVKNRVLRGVVSVGALRGAGHRRNETCDRAAGPLLGSPEPGPTGILGESRCVPRHHVNRVQTPTATVNAPRRGTGIRRSTVPRFGPDS